MLNRLRWLLLSFRGRLPRSSFWWMCAWVWAAFVVLFVAVEKGLGYGSTLVLYPPLLWSLAALSTKRLHDRGKSPLWFLLLLVPVIGVLWVAIELGFRRGSTGENQYGEDPTEHRHDYLTVS